MARKYITLIFFNQLDLYMATVDKLVSFTKSIFGISGASRTGGNLPNFKGQDLGRL